MESHIYVILSASPDFYSENKPEVEILWRCCRLAALPTVSCEDDTRGFGVRGGGARRGFAGSVGPIDGV